MKRRRLLSPLEESELVGVPHYTQGEADGLCVYYAMSMMLAALHPAWGSTLHEAPRYSWKGSPVFQALRRHYKTERLFKEKLADWFFDGMSLSEATKILNGFFRERNKSKLTYFTLSHVRSRRATTLRKHSVAHALTVNDVLTAISWHLPVIVAGGGVDSHAVVAIGYSVKGAADRSICFLDPGVVRPEWRACGDVFTEDAEVIMPNETEFRDYRLGRLFTKGRGPKFELWKPAFLDE